MSEPVYLFIFPVFDSIIGFYDGLAASKKFTYLFSYNFILCFVEDEVFNKGVLINVQNHDSRG